VGRVTALRGRVSLQQQEQQQLVLALPSLPGGLVPGQCAGGGRRKQPTGSSWAVGVQARGVQPWQRAGVLWMVRQLGHVPCSSVRILVLVILLHLAASAVIRQGSWLQANWQLP
jgi:hypothetical protein